MKRLVVVLVAQLSFLAFSTSQGQESVDQKDALAIVAKIDGKVAFDPKVPGRVIGIDV